MNILSPFVGPKIKFENYCLTDNGNYAELVKRVFAKVKIENKNPSMVIPFPRMSKTDENVWSEYCPNKEKIENASIAVHEGALGVIEKYKPNFDEIEVWYESADQVDPILVGKKYDSEQDKKKGYTWNMKSYLLCRWGEALKEFKEIKQQVYDSYTKRERIKLQAELNNLEMVAMERFGI